MPSKTKSAARKGARKPGPRRTPTRWSAQVMKTSDAMDLPSGVFKLRSARAIALSLKKSSEASRRRKSTPFRSAMSMLNFEINRAGTTLPAGRRKTLERAKSELRKLFGRPDSASGAPTRGTIRE